MTSWHDHAGALPLRSGEKYCAKHAAQAEQPALHASATTDDYVPDGTVCATCRGTNDLSKDPSDVDGAWYCQRCWDEWERRTTLLRRCGPP
jgi:hypothetical protein